MNRYSSRHIILCSCSYYFVEILLQKYSKTLTTIYTSELSSVQNDQQ